MAVKKTSIKQNRVTVKKKPGKKNRRGGRTSVLLNVPDLARIDYDITDMSAGEILHTIYAEGDRVIRVYKGSCRFACIYRPDAISALFEAMICEMLKYVKKGQMGGIVSTGAGIQSKVGPLRFLRLEESPHRLAGHYSNVAVKRFEEKLITSLFTLRHDLFLTVMKLVLAELKRDGFVEFVQSTGQAEMWRDYLQQLGQRIKEEYGVPKQGRKKARPPETEYLLALLECYNEKLNLLKSAKRTFKNAKYRTKSTRIKKIKEDHGLAEEYAHV